MGSGREAGDGVPVLTGESPKIREANEAIALAALSDETVLILGETGVGKEVGARAIHGRSDRAAGPFIAVNCAAIPENLVEAELFGHEPGAFTDAKSRRIGEFEQAHGGTLFLDEIGRLSKPAQEKILRAVEDQVIVRVGGTERIPVDVRIIAATNKDLPVEVAEDRFLADLLYRLAVLIVRIPPLRDRLGDIAALARDLLAGIAAGKRCTAPSLRDGGLDALADYDWPGNVRELENALRRAWALARYAPEIPASAVRASVAGSRRFRIPPSSNGRDGTPKPPRHVRGRSATDWRVPPGVDFLNCPPNEQRRYIEEASKATGENKAHMADLLGISREGLRMIGHRLGLR